MTKAKRLYILLCGFEILPKTVCTRDRGERFVMSLPISAYLVETTIGYVLIDAGLNSRNLRDPALRERYFGESDFPPPVVLPQHELLHQLREIGVTPEDVAHVVLSHLHVDHAGNLEHFTHARLSVQRSEYEHAFSDEAGKAYARTDYDLPGLEWHLVEGDWEVAPGLRAVLTRGHTPGHQSFIVDLPETGQVVLTADAGDLRENFDERILPGGSVDDEAAAASIARLAELGERHFLVVGHDPQQIRQVRLAPAYYD